MRLNSELMRLLPRYTALTEDEQEQLHERAAREQAALDRAIERERLDKRRRVLLAMGVSQGEHIDVKVEDSEPRRLLRAALLAHRDNRRSPRQGCVLLLAGSNGVGKSLAAVQWLWRAKGQPWYCTAERLVAFNAEQLQEPPPPFGSARCFVLDQLGHERRSNRLPELFTHVLGVGGVLVATTDLTPSQFREHPNYAGHVVDRLDEVRPGRVSGIVHCGGESFRTMGASRHE